jgi:hypothetical protein
MLLLYDEGYRCLYKKVYRCLCFMMKVIDEVINGWWVALRGKNAVFIKNY